MNLPFDGVRQRYTCPRCPKLTPASEEEDEHRHETDSHPKLTGTSLLPFHVPSDKTQLGLVILLAISFHHTRPHRHYLPSTDKHPIHGSPLNLGRNLTSHIFISLSYRALPGEITTALDLWAAAVLKYGGDIPWKNADELYASIDSIQHGDAPWKVVRLRYRGPLPAGTPPKWMTETYELCTRNVRTVLHNQLATADFKDKFNYTPYRQYNAQGKRVFSNLMSGEWAWRQATTLPMAAHSYPTSPGSDKTTVSVATGHQEYHPVYGSPGNLTGVARRAHGNGILPIAFLPIAKTSKRQRKTIAFQKFVRQMYHACLARVFEPLKAGMTTPEVVRCPDGHFRRVIYGLGPYIADYPEQVWLSCIVQGWCPKCDAPPNNLDVPGTRRLRSHPKTDFLITCFDPGTLWDDFGIRNDLVPFTHDFPRAEIYELLSPDLLHQIIKGTFKDHLVEWVMQYLHGTHGEARALEIIADIDHRIAAVPSFPGLRRFPDGRDFQQWTGDDSKALMKVYLSAIAGHVPSEMVKCISAFLDFCYLVRRNALTSDTLDEIDAALARFHTHRDIFIATGVRVSISLPRQHSMVHYRPSIILFGSPNGLCSSITESKHIKAVKEPWRRSNRYNAIFQMLRTIARLDRLAALRDIFSRQGMLQGSTTSYALRTMRGELPQPPPAMNEEDDDGGDSPGPKSLSSVELAQTAQRTFPKNVTQLAAHINQPRLVELIRRFLYDQLNPNSALPSSQIPIDSCPFFNGRVDTFLSAIARFYAPSDLCGAGGMYRERIRANPNWRGKYPRHDTVFVITDPDLPGMEGMVIARTLLFFSFTHQDTYYPCALVHWYSPVGNRPDKDTGMWVVAPEFERNGRKSLAVIHLDCIARGPSSSRVRSSYT
ncbi:hypothetical protein MSAN_02089300 [Mycena sanguinolenta]|uniref:C2H2-type domain-containing protein n=1 Tax=Mycena sanguinolenta TaxID=230812 RepID=A0A8H7CKL2_9AGAR|nr:hypothetical protein MSAN_02089300 [Mycena sanguinolenta]